MEDLQPKPATPQQQQQQPTITADTIAEREAETRQEEARTVRYAIDKLMDFLRWFVTVLEVLLAIRFVFKLIGADPTNLFAGFLYALTDIILSPFSTLVRSPSLHVNQAFEWSTLIAMVIYWLLFWAIIRFLRIIASPSEDPPAS
ncbi:MAG TPA: hypothetical protein DHW02_16350 [Ktedonobacter sp.]|nr:hypothetical protein [Ktedonobacter sp.]